MHRIAIHNLKIAALVLSLGAALAQGQTQTKGYMVGYFGSWNAWGGYRASNVPWDKLTHVIFSFLTPGAGGSFTDFDGTEKAELPNIVSQAHAKGVKVLVSAGGINGSAGYAALAANAGARATFASSLRTYVDNNNLDGVDIDWEFPSSATDSTNYAAMIKEIRAKMSGKLLTAALAPDNLKGQFIPKSALLIFDFCNIMAFDYTGAFPGSLVGQHSTLIHAKNGLQYWKARGLVKDKCVIGIPQYGKNFNAGGADMAYNTIVSSYPGLAANVDETNKIFFNGPGTVKDKATYVAQNVYAGCMFWELSQDRSSALISAAKEGLKATPTSVLPVLSYRQGRSGGASHLSLTGLALLPSGLRDALGRVPSPSQASAAGNFYLPAGISDQNTPR